MTHPPDDFTSRDLARIEDATREIGRHIFAHTENRQAHIFERRWWDERIMGWAMQDESLKIQLFRFVDVLPMLRSPTAVTRHLQEYLHEASDALPRTVRWSLDAARPNSILGRAVAMAARRNATAYARRFIAGTTTNEVLSAARQERKRHRAFTIDVLGEAVTSEREADAYLRAYIDLLEGISPTVNGWPEDPRIDRGVFSELPRVNVSVKLSALDSQFDAIDAAGSLARVGERLRALLRVAARERAFVNIDMESYDKKDLTLDIFRAILAEDEFRRTQDIGIVIQCYLRDSLADLHALRDWARQRGAPVWVRLVKGAYWDYETVHAQAHGWPVPVFAHKPATDANYERATRFVMLNHEWLRPALGSHNVRSLAHGIATARHVGLPMNGFELQMLYGMGDAMMQAIVDLGHRLRIYMPYGELIPGMAYLVRRLLENTSNDSFLRASFTEHVDPEKLLMSPLGDHFGAPPTPARPPQSAAARHAHPFRTFKNEPPTDFAREEHRAAMVEAILSVRAEFGRHEPLRIGGREVETSDRISSINPSHTRQIVGTAASAGTAEAREAVRAAAQSARDWRARPVAERAACLERAADEMARRRFELAAWMVHECGKPWREADGDVAEAIDFCRYYAIAAQALQGEFVHVPGEENYWEYIPRGVTAVIAPWNFPLAILTGMTTAALVTGNPVIMKPAEQSPLIAAQLYHVLSAAGVPPGVLQYLPGPGETAGAALVEHPDVATIAFTGSRAVGLAINRRAAEVSAAGRKLVKHVICEMGGKNAIIVDDDADLDEAVLGVAQSAFGYQGQKCSACSRAIVLAGVYDAFLDRLVAAAQSFKVGPAEDPGTTIGPLIDADSVTRVRRYIERGKQEGRAALESDIGPLAEEGYFVGPHIFADVPPQASIAQEEIFGPVLAVLRSDSFDEAIRIANDTDYALTGGVFSRSPANLDRAQCELEVGNLYLNRGITGALVGRQPFGGFKMSGIGTKAGGPDYLLQFVIPRTVTENTLRRGFAPAAES